MDVKRPSCFGERVFFSCFLTVELQKASKYLATNFPKYHKLIQE